MCCELRSGPPLTGPLRSYFLLPQPHSFEGVGAIAEPDVIAGGRRVASGESGYGLKVAGERR